MSQYFRKTSGPSGRDINVKADLYNYATKTDLKYLTRIRVSKLAAKSDLASLKLKIDKLNIDKLVPVPFDLSKLSDAVKMTVLKICVCQLLKLVAEANNIDTSLFALKTKYNAGKSELENKISDADKKIPNTSGLVKK